MLIQYDREADSIYIKLKQGRYAYGKDLDQFCDASITTPTGIIV